MAQTYRDRYLAAVHAMQSGVAMEMQIDPSSTEPKHLRVGINAAMADMGGLAGLLIAKGIITADEYQKAVATSMEAEKARYEIDLSSHFGKKITLA